MLAKVDEGDWDGLNGDAIFSFASVCLESDDSDCFCWKNYIPNNHIKISGMTKAMITMSDLSAAILLKLAQSCLNAFNHV